MPKETVTASLNDKEKSVAKALLDSGWTNQDVHYLINLGRPKTVNFGRVSGLSKDKKIQPAAPSEVSAYRQKKLLFDHKTGLCPFDDERLVRAREAMILAVELFNTPRFLFKAGVFSMLANVAWTYLLHEHFEREGVEIVNKDGFSLLLSQMIARNDCPLSKHVKNNLEAIKEIRDVVEHQTIGPFDRKWTPIFQACCLNFEKYLTELFGNRLSLGSDLGFVIQFAKMSAGEIATLQGFDLPKHIQALDASLAAKLADGDADNLEYQFNVVYTLTNSSKSKAHFQFVQPDSAEGKEIQNVLIKFKPADDLFPLKPTEAVKLIANGSGRNFTSDKHQRAWKMFKARPRTGAADPAATDKKFAIYHPPTRHIPIRFNALNL